MSTGWTIGRALLVGLLWVLGFTANADAAVREFSISGSLTVEIDEYVFGTDPDGLGELTIDNGFRNHDSLWMSIGAVLSDEFSVHRIDLRLDDPSMTAFSMAALPSSLDLADFAEPSLTFTGSGLESFIYMDIQTLRPIPEPGTALCLLAGLALLSREGRRR